MTSSYPSATSQATLPGHSNPQMATATKTDGTPIAVNSNAQVDFIKTLPRKDVTFGAQAGMDRDRLPTVKQTELYSTHANTSTGTMTQEKQISTFDTQVAAHSPTVSNRPHLTDTVLGMANKAKDMIFGHKTGTTTTTTVPTVSSSLPSYSTIKTTSTYPVDPTDAISDVERRYAMTTATQSMGVIDNSDKDKNVTIASATMLPTTSSRPISATATTTPSTIDKAKDWIATEKTALSNTARGAVDKTKDLMTKEQAALSSNAQKLTDKAKDLMGNGPHVKTTSKTTIQREPLDVLVQEQDFLEPAIHKETAPRTFTSMKIEKTPSIDASQPAAPELYGAFSHKRVPHSPTLIDQIASRDPTAIGAEPEDNMAMYMAEKYRGEHMH